jgi:DNA-directed RNA polymerase subunit E'/Rpb7
MKTTRMPLFKPVFMDQRVSLTPSEFREAAEDIDTFLLKKMKKGLEGLCCTHGYVRPRSTQILARSMGQAEHGRFTGDFMFHCKLKLMCLLPHADQIVDAQILKVNKLGAYALVVDEGRALEAMRILVPRDLHIGSPEFDAISVGQGIRVKLLRSRFQSKDTFIQAVGLFEGMAPAADKKEVVEEPPEVEEVADKEKKLVLEAEEPEAKPETEEPESKPMLNASVAVA